MRLKQYGYNSKNYQQGLQLRDKILRKPLGMNLCDENLSQDKNDIHIGAFENDVLVGVIIFSVINEKIIKMRQVAVDDEFQNRGIGSAMVKFCEKYAIENGYKTIILHARKSVIEFYDKLGYETIGEAFTEVSLPHLKMIKNLNGTG